MNKQEIKRHFRSGDVPTEAQFAEWIERCVIWIDDAAELPDACVALAGTCYLVAGKAVARCENSVEGWRWVLKGNGGGGTTSYPELTDKPRINRTVLSGSMTPADLTFRNCGRDPCLTMRRSSSSATVATVTRPRSQG